MYDIAPLLYIHRDEVGLRRCDGETVALSPLPDALSQPIRIAMPSNIDIRGISSGYRSALVFSNGKMYRIKGVRPFRRPRRKDSPEPLGGQYLSRAMLEIENMSEISELFEKEGLPYPCRPVGYYKYPIQFMGERLGASIFEVQGDTRLDEFVAWLEDDIREERRINYGLCNIFGILGTKAGRLKRMMDDHGYSWDKGNAHPGNFVVFEREGYIHLGIVDLDSTVRLGEEVKELQREENGRLSYDMLAMRMSSIHRNTFRLSRRRRSPYTYPTPLRLSLMLGFIMGHKHSKDSPLREDMIYEAKKEANVNLRDGKMGMVLTFPSGDNDDPKRMFFAYNGSMARVCELKLGDLKRS